ncbi:MAG TPA: hypothetical protein VGF67_22565 [Ktedonobacteraceae bacterium]|jgi:hypothetical protein
MKRLLWLIVCTLLLAPGLLACETTGGALGSAATSTPAHRPAAVSSPVGVPPRQPTAAPGITQELARIATRFYTLIKARNYAQAYTYLDAHATDSAGQAFTSQSFVQQAQSRDSEAGTIVGFSVSVFTPTVIIATVTRSLLGPYHAHIQMKLEGTNWKILALDRI